MLCTNRPEGFGPLSTRYPHILTSCFLDTILVPLCTWLYLLAILILIAIPTSHPRKRHNENTSDKEEQSGTILDAEVLHAQDITDPAQRQIYKPRSRKKLHLCLTILYYALLLAQILMCILEITRLSLANLGIGLLPFTFITLISAALLNPSASWFSTNNSSLRLSREPYRYITLSVWIALAITNGVKIAEEVKEGVGMRKGSKYPVADEVTDVGVMVGVYVALGVLEVVRR
ncbi:hypothetical protein MMC09_006955 [Bachmanniomyces sp. S44760]|nr:hypothetical protein [Bachmanniomyces sp. S44760]